jgi:hypothetical protein
VQSVASRPLARQHEGYGELTQCGDKGHRAPAMDGATRPITPYMTSRRMQDSKPRPPALELPSEVWTSASHSQDDSEEKEEEQQPRRPLPSKLEPLYSQLSFRSQRSAAYDAEPPKQPTKVQVAPLPASMLMGSPHRDTPPRTSPFAPTAITSTVWMSISSRVRDVLLRLFDNVHSKNGKGTGANSAMSISDALLGRRTFLSPPLHPYSHPFARHGVSSAGSRAARISKQDNSSPPNGFACTPGGSPGGVEAFTGRPVHLLTTCSSAKPAAACMRTLTIQRWCGVGGAGPSIVHAFLSELQTSSGHASGQDEEDDRPDPRMLTGSELWEMYRIIDPTVRVWVWRETAERRAGSIWARHVFSTRGQARGSGREAEGVSRAASRQLMSCLRNPRRSRTQAPRLRAFLFCARPCTPWERRCSVGERVGGHTARRE